jgi:protein-disulfide isomerase
MSGEIAAMPALENLRLSSSPSIGTPDSRTVIIEFSDMFCPACRRIQGNLEAAVARLPSTRLVFKNFPLATLHPLSPQAAMLGVAAHEKSLFWEYLHAVINTDPVGTEDELLRLAASVGVITNDISINRVTSSPRHRYLQMVARDVALGNALGVTSTPYFVIITDGQPVRWYAGGAIFVYLRENLSEGNK